MSKQTKNSDEKPTPEISQAERLLVVVALQDLEEWKARYYGKEGGAVLREICDGIDAVQEKIKRDPNIRFI